MILVIDTSSSRSALGFIDRTASTRHDVIFGSRDPYPPLSERLRAAVGDLKQIEKVVIATGPGSFTGLRRGASFGLGVAMGLGVPVVPVPTLHLQAARGKGRFTAIVEAGRGRFYFLPPGGQATLGSPDEIPTDLPLVGLLSSESEALFWNTEHPLAGHLDVQTVAEAAEELLKTAREVPYGSVKLEYVQSFGGSKT